MHTRTVNFMSVPNVTFITLLLAKLDKMWHQKNIKKQLVYTKKKYFSKKSILLQMQQMNRN